MSEKKTIEVRIPAHDSNSKVFQKYDDFLTNIRDTNEKNPDTTLEETRRMFDHWGDHTKDPAGIDYEVVNANGVSAMWATPKGCVEDRVLISSHGGGYLCGSMYTHRKLYATLAKAVNCRALIVDYRLCPDNPWSSPVNDVFTVYEWLLSQGIKAEHIAFTGDSAGGGLSVSVPLLIRQKGLPMAAASMPLSPWGDLEAIGPTYLTNEKDSACSASLISGMGSTVVGPGGDLHNPLVAPIYATDLTGLPPMFIQVGGYENFIDDARVIAENARKSGIEVKLEILEGMQHVSQITAGYTPEANEALGRLAEWVKPKLGLK